MVRRLLEVSAPNFAEMSLEQAIELRDSRLWKDFRGFISELLSDIKTNPDVLIDASSFERAVELKISRAFFEEAGRKHPTGLSLSVDLGLGVIGLIPGYSLVAGGASAGKSFYQYLSGRSGWYAFLLELNKNR